MMGDVSYPMNQATILATLMAVLELASVEDAANAVGLPPEALVTEAQSWAVGS